MSAAGTSTELGGTAAGAPAPARAPRGLLAGLTLTELRAAVRRTWLAAVVGTGLLLAVIAAIVAATHDGGARADSLRASAASILLLGGLALSATRGASLVNRDANSGYLGLLVASGATRAGVGVSRILARLGILAAGMLAWSIALQIGSLAIGRGLDGPLAVHSAASLLDMTVVFLVAGLASAGFGPIASWIGGICAHVAIQAFANLDAAGDAGVLGGVAAPTMGALYAVFPRAVESPMITELQLRGEAGAAAPRFEINNAIVAIPASSAWDVLWTLGWCAGLALLIVAALRRRTL